MKKGKMLVRASLLAAMCFVATWIVQIPVPPGYVNFGDCVVLLAGWLLGPWWGGAAAAVGSVLVDVLGPFAVYAPATFVIRFVMAVLAAVFYRRLAGKNHRVWGMVVGAVLAECLMVLGYLCYEWFALGLGAAALGSVPFNMIQGFIGGVAAVTVGVLMGRSGAIKRE
ncbi:MAG: ECF transporter S component [Oscillospiraceae bacterium]|nr:ECF transporter S component [Oscillospiraceae bacterium]